MIIAAADGSSLSNPGPTGWAWYIDEDSWAAGGWPEGTNNQGELMAVLDLLRATAGVDEPLHVLCDSQYVIRSITEWLPGWKRKGWRKADGSPVLNQDLMRELDAELAGRAVTFEWVKGHAGHELNERVDDLARAAATAYRDGHAVDSGPGFFGRPVPHETQLDLFSDGNFDGFPAGGIDGLVPNHSTQDLEAVVVQLETAWVSDAVRTDRGEAAALVHPEFQEITADGRCWSGMEVLDQLAPIWPRPEIEVLSVAEVAPGQVLVVSRADTPMESLICSSWWCHIHGSWRLRFRQSTTQLGERLC